MGFEAEFAVNLPLSYSAWRPQFFSFSVSDFRVKGDVSLGTRDADALVLPRRGLNRNPYSACGLGPAIPNPPAGLALIAFVPA